MVGYVNAVQPYLMQKVCTFGSYGTSQALSGMTNRVFKPAFKVHFSNVKQTRSQKYELIGTSFENSRVIKIQHGKENSHKLQSCTCVQISGVTYDILDVSLDEDSYVTYDLITIKESKRGAGHE